MCPQITFLGEYSRRRVRVGCATTPETAVAIVIKTTRTDTDQVSWELGAVVITAAVATEGQQQRHALMHP